MDASWFGPRLKELREQAGWTQPELADRAGMNRFGIAKLEQGVALPNWGTVVALCRALGTTPDAFARAPAQRQPASRGRPKRRQPNSR
jgi:putative transcriptional regulator